MSPRRLEWSVVLTRIRANWNAVRSHARRRTGDASDAVRLRFNPSRRRALVQAAAGCTSPADWYLFSAANLGGGAIQLEDEIVAFVAEAQSRAPVRICEIGTQYGGTNLLLFRTIPTVRLVIGVDLWVQNKATLRLLRAPGQRLVYLDGSSTKPRQLSRVRRTLAGEPLDLLLIDGDHSFAGVRADFLAYRHLVRDGGLIAFHDIVPDGRAAGLQTRAYAGGVPEFWALMKALYPAAEFVHDWHGQYGFGIGIITYSPEVPINPYRLVKAAMP